MLADALSRLLTGARKKLGLRHALAELDPDLSARPLHFRAPPITPELVAAIKLISPQFRLRPDEASRRFWERNQNGLCWGEFLALEPFLGRLPERPKVLDIGPGMGRSTTFFKKIMGWERAPFTLYESGGDSTRYTKAGPRFDDSFCGNFEALESVLRFNEIEHYEIVDAAAIGASLAQLEGPFDFVYSFFAIGFHWSIEHFLDEILGLMHDESIGAFTLHPRFRDFHVLGDTPHRVVPFQRSWPRGRRSDLLVLAKTEKALAIS